MAIHVPNSYMYKISTHTNLWILSSSSFFTTSWMFNPSTDLYMYSSKGNILASVQGLTYIYVCTPHEVFLI